MEVISNKLEYLFAVQISFVSYLFNLCMFATSAFFHLFFPPILQVVAPWCVGSSIDIL